jgi:hypothetical protein
VTLAVVRGMASRLPVIGAAAALAVAALTGCSSQSRARLPASSAGPSAPPVTPAAASGSAEAAVIAAYTRYFPVLTAAEAAGGSRAEAMLAPYAAQPYLSHVLSQMAVYGAQHEVSVGYLVPHIMQVTVKGAQATVRDCQDASHAALADSRTGHVITGTRGSARTYLIATLARGNDGRWRLTSLAHVAVPCQPVPSPS